MVYDSDAREAEVTALESLAAELATRGYEAHIQTPPGKVPALLVTNPAATALSETVMAGAEHYWYSWAEQIAPLTDAAAAADRIARVLAPAPGDSA